MVIFLLQWFYLTFEDDNKILNKQFAIHSLSDSIHQDAFQSSIHGFGTK
jgi:hypothetical protein